MVLTLLCCLIQTVTAVAAIQDSAVRAHFCSIYWLVVGADAVGARIGALQAILYKQLTGKAVKGDENDDHERQSMLVGAMVEKRRALVVLDDPWMPEQVRFLNPVDGSQCQRLNVSLACSKTPFLDIFLE